MQEKILIDLEQKKIPLTKNQMQAKAELVLMGRAQPVDSVEEMKFIIDYISTVLKNSKIVLETESADQIWASATHYTKKAVPLHLCMNTIMDMAMLTIHMRTSEDGKKVPNLLSRNGAFGFVYNYTYPDLSELGYTFFENRNGFFYRIG